MTIHLTILIITTLAGLIVTPLLLRPGNALDEKLPKTTKPPKSKR